MRSANAGFYKTSCTTEDYCPTDQFSTIKWQKFTYQLPIPYAPSLNRCGNIQCIDGYFMNRYEYSSIMGNTISPGCKSGPMTGNLAYGIENMAACKAKLETVCQLSKTCASGYTYLRNKDGEFVLSTNPSDDGDKICVECPVCPRGTYLASPCTMSSYPVCVKCPWNGWYNMYEHQGQCIMDYDLPPGFFPYQAWITAAYKQGLTQYDIFPKQMLQQDGTLININDFILFLNYLVPCSALPEGYEFKAWSTRPVVKVKVLNTGESFPTSETCDLLNSARCMSYSKISQKGWFLNSSNVCQRCKSSSFPYQTCDWSEYGNLETCNGLQDTQCAPCRGTKGPEAVYTNSYAPFFFDDSVAFPCNYDCNIGFYKNDEGICTLCTNKPDNSIYAKGPLRIDDTELDGKYCISATNCRYFGGTKSKGCDWECLPNFRKIEKYGVTPREYMCEACPVVTCSSGFRLERPSFSPCLACVSCNDKIANAYYTEQCNQVCNSGFYKKNDTFCEKCMLKTCQSNEFNAGCSGSFDYYCSTCNICPVGSTIKGQCNSTHNTRCEGCTTVLLANSEYDSSCRVVCSTGFVLSNGQCVRCASSDNDCQGGKYYTPTCTEFNKGCLNCTSPDTYNYCWVSGLQSCQWSCARFFRKTANVCVPDNSVTIYPQCLTAIVLPPPTTSITLLSTTVLPLQTTTAITSSTLHTSTSTSFLLLQTTSKLTASSSQSLPTTTFKSTSTTNALTSPSQLVTASKYTSTTSKLPLSTSKILLSTTQFTTTPEPETFRYAYEISNLLLQQCLCKYQQFAKSLSDSFNTPVYIISCTNFNENIICVNFTCPCNNSGRRLLQIATNVTVVQLVAEKNIVLNESAMNVIVKTTFSSQAAVAASSVQKLDMKGVYWNTNELFKQFLNNIAKNDDITMFIIIGVVGGVVLIGIVVALVLIFYVFKKEIFGDDSSSKPIQTKQRLALYVKLNQKVN